MSDQHKLLVIANKFLNVDSRHVVLVVRESAEHIVIRHLFVIDERGVVKVIDGLNNFTTLHKKFWRVLLEIETIDAALPPELIQ